MSSLNISYPEDHKFTKKQVIDVIENRGTLYRADLSGLNLKEIDFAGISLSDAVL
jgi:uncharacterized protein YjbI with pentapeptide repeats